MTLNNLYLIFQLHWFHTGFQLLQKALISELGIWVGEGHSQA